MAWDSAFEVAFHPKVVAFVGVSAKAKTDRGGAGFIKCFEELGFSGRIYAVNPRIQTFDGRRVYPSVSAIPEPVDLVIVPVPAPAVPQVLEDCITANAKNIHVYTSGFEETGEKEGTELGRQIREISIRGGLRVVGPNCVGLYVPSAGIGTYMEMPRTSGPVGLISQSGGHLNWLTHFGPDYGFAFSKAISFGNGTILDSTDFLEYLSGDPETKIICMYLEGVKDGRKLLRLVREAKKPVIIYKAGRSEAGLRAIASHTAALSGSQAVWRAFFKQSGAIEVNSLEEMAEMAMTLLYVKPPSGNGIALLNNGGGSSVEAADWCTEEGLEVPELSRSTQEALAGFVNLAGQSIRNPLDTTLFRDVDLFMKEMELVAADPVIDMLIVTPHLDQVRTGGPDRIDYLFNRLADFSRNNVHGKRLALTLFPHNSAWEVEMRLKLMKELPGRGLATYSSLNAACRSLARLWKYYRGRPS